MWHLNDWFPVLLSLRVAFISLILVVLLALPLARILGLYQFRGRDILEAIFTLPLVLPPSVVGYGLLVLIGRNGILGKYLNDMDRYDASHWVQNVVQFTVE
jgi:molybdate transport system permease protein